MLPGLAAARSDTVPHDTSFFCPAQWEIYRNHVFAGTGMARCNSGLADGRRLRV
jgi:hypothetical protein